MRKLTIKNKKFVGGGATAIALAMTACAVGNTGAAKPAEDRTLKAEKEDTKVATVTDAQLDTDDLVDKISGDLVTEKDVYKDETVYAFADAEGHTKNTLVNEVLHNPEKKAELTDTTNLTGIVNLKGDETFTQDKEKITWKANGADIYYQGTTDEKLPVSVAATYYLDGKKVSPSELAGKSGHVKIRFDYSNEAEVTKKIGGKDEKIKVPFVAVTGMLLSDDFKNVTVTNGKATTEGGRNIVIGYALPGLADSLKVKESDFSKDITFPEYFEVEADVDDFELDMTVTVLMNASAMNLTGDIDMEAIDGAMEDMGDAAGQIAKGSGDLAEGSELLFEKMGEFNTGVGQLKSGIDKLSDSTQPLEEGVATLNASAHSVSGGVAQLDAGLKAPMSEEQKAAVYANASAQAQAAAQQQLAQQTTDYDAIQAQAEKAAVDAATAELAKKAEATKSGLSTTIGNGMKSTSSGVAEGMDEAGAIDAAVAAAGITDPNMKAAVKEAIKTQIIPGAINSAADAASPQLAAGIAGNIGDNVVASAKSAAGTAAVATAKQANAAAGEAVVAAVGSAAGNTAVATVGATKAEIAGQIETVGESGYSLVTGSAALAEGTQTLQDKMPTLEAGINQLAEGADLLATGSSQLTDGAGKLADGSEKLSGGIEQFNKEAIGKLISTYNGDVKDLAERVQAVLKASSEYETFTGLCDGDSGTTKFIIKTEGISAD